MRADARPVPAGSVDVWLGDAIAVVARPHQTEYGKPSTMALSNTVLLCLVPLMAWLATTAPVPAVGIQGRVSVAGSMVAMAMSRDSSVFTCARERRPREGATRENAGSPSSPAPP